MFFQAASAGPQDGSLDDFYDSLPPSQARSATVYAGRPARPYAESGDSPVAPVAPYGWQGRAAGSGHGADSGAAALAAALASSESERARLAGEAGALRAGLEAARAEGARLAGEAARANALARRVSELEARLAEAEQAGRRARRAGHGEASIVLGAADERLKVGGDGWECNVVGHLERCAGGEVVLVVADPRYGETLLASAVPGRMAVLSASGRTDCEYYGCCARIYGDAGSLDFVACLRARLAEPDSGPGGSTGSTMQEHMT